MAPQRSRGEGSDGGGTGGAVQPHKKKKKRSGNRKPKQANCNFLLVLYGLWIVPDHVPIRLTIYSHYTTTPYYHTTLVDGY